MNSLLREEGHRGGSGRRGRQWLLWVLRQNGRRSHHGECPRIRRSGRPCPHRTHSPHRPHGVDVHAVGGEEYGRLRGHHETVRSGRPASVNHLLNSVLRQLSSFRSSVWKCSTLIEMIFVLIFLGHILFGSYDRKAIDVRFRGTQEAIL